MTGQIVFENEEIRVVHRPGSSDFTLVTFAAMGHRPKDDWIWAGEPIGKLGIEAIGIIGTRPHWYPAASMRAAAPVIRSLLRPRAIGYGFSMGGYGVLKYGRLLGLTHGFAVSPQVSIDPADAPWDRRFRHHHDPALHAGMLVAPEEPPPLTIVAGDTAWEPDALHLRHIQDWPDIHVMRLDFMKHAAIERFTSTRVIAPVLDLMLAGDPAALRTHLRRGRAQSAPAHLWLGRAAAVRGHLRMAERLWTLAATLGAPASEVAMVRALSMRERLAVLFMARRAVEARAFIRTAIEAQVGRARGLTEIGRFLHDHGMPGRAAGCFRLAIRAKPSLAEAHLGLLRALGDFAPEEVFIRAQRAALRALGDRPVDATAAAAMKAYAAPG